MHMYLVSHTNNMLHLTLATVRAGLALEAAKKYLSSGPGQYKLNWGQYSWVDSINSMEKLNSKMEELEESITVTQIKID